MASFPQTPQVPKIKDGKILDSNPLHVPYQFKFKTVFNVLKEVGSGKPSDNFTIDFNTRSINGNKGLSFK